MLLRHPNYELGGREFESLRARLPYTHSVSGCYFIVYLSRPSEYKQTLDSARTIVKLFQHHLR